MRRWMLIAVPMVAAGGPAGSQLPAGVPGLACPASPAGVARALGVRIPRAPGPVTPAFGGTTRGTVTGAAPLSFTNRWASAGKTTFSHVIEGPPGPVRLTLETCSSATGGETVAIYPATAAGERMPRRPRVMFSIAVPRGNVRTATVVIPRPRAREDRGSVHLAVVVENASGRFHEGSYRLTVTR